jgi:hypothetical protein
LKADVNTREAALRNDPDYSEVIEEDKAALDMFRKTGDLGHFIPIEDDTTTVKSKDLTNALSNADSTVFTNTDETTNTHADTNTSGKRSSARSASSNRSYRDDGGGSISSTSIRSKFSSSQSLSPLHEDDEEDGHDINDTSHKVFARYDDDISRLSPATRRSEIRTGVTVVNDGGALSIASVEHSVESIAEGSEEGED